MRVMLLPVLATWLIQAAVYGFFILRAGRSDWVNLVAVLGMMLAGNLLAALVLTAVKKQNSPLTTALVLALVMFVFGVAGLSAIRLPISYVALAFCAPISSVGLAVANNMLQKANRHRVGLLDFAGGREVQQQFPFPVPLVSFDTPDLLTYDLVLIDTKAHHTPEFSAAITRLYIRGIEVVPWSYHLERVTGQVSIEDFDVSDLVFRADQIYYSIVKRALDVISVIILTPLALPVAGLIWFYIRLLDGTPSVFVQERRGRLGGSFRMYKFRTMRNDSEAGATQSNDDRILPGCTILRQLRLDELPQLINILKGEMSWIGPRPVSLEIAEALERRLPQYINRQLVLPGLTGWAQVTLGYASTIDEEVRKLSFDLYYIKHMSFDLDLLILAKTVRTVLWRAGAR
jgi:lipopolysaccharide/colanic/teichoic acid biosynthesis glycosyltransferase